MYRSVPGRAGAGLLARLALVAALWAVSSPLVAAPHGKRGDEGSLRRAGPNISRPAENTKPVHATPAKPLPEWAREISWRGRTVRVHREHLIVKFRDGVDRPGRERALARHSLEALEHNALVGADLVRVAPGRDLAAALKALAGDGSVEYCEPDFLREPSVYPVPDDPKYQEVVTAGYGQFALVNTMTDRAWNDPDLVDARGLASHIGAVLDTGVHYQHEDFDMGGGQYRILRSASDPAPLLGGEGVVGWDYASNDADPDDINDNSYVGHGTHVAGTIGAAVNNGKGVAGMTWYPKLMPVRVCGKNLCGTFAVIQGIDFAIANGANVINMSLGSPDYSTSEHNAVKRAAAAGVVVVCASGNDNGPVGYPAANPEAIAVGAVKRDDQRASFSNYGPELDIVAPGEGAYPIRILSTYYTGGYKDLGGTSMACPHVAGLALALLGQNPDWAPETVRRRLEETADKVPPFAGSYDGNGWNQYMGHGRINTYHALGGIDSGPDYGATVYLRDSRTVLSAPVGANPVDRHRFVAGASGTATFTLNADDRDVATIASAVLEVRKPVGGPDFYPLVQTVITSRLSSFSAVVPVVPVAVDSEFIPRAIITDSAGKVSVIPLPSYTVPGVGGAWLDARLCPVPAPPIPEAGSFELRLTVTNVGTSLADNVLPELEANSGGAFVSPVSGPVPAGPVSLAAGAAQTFTWVFNAVSGGTATFTATATGWSPATSSGLLADDSVSVTIEPPVVLSGMMWFDPSPATQGLFFESYLRVDNSGKADATMVLPEIEVNSGASLVIPAGGPVPAGPVDIPAGSSVTFTWTWRGNIPGTASFTATATGWDAMKGVWVSAAASGAEMIQPPSSGWSCTPRVAWSRTHNSPADQDDDISGAAFDPAGNIFLACDEERSDLLQGYNWVARKYSPTGDLLWEAPYNSPANGDEIAQSVATDSSGNAYMVGYETRTDLGQSTNWLVRKYDSAGGITWERTYDNPANSADAAMMVATDPWGNCVVTGYEYRPDLSQATNMLTRKYDPDGNLLWSRTYNGVESSWDLAYCVATDTSGNVVIAGYEDRWGAGQDFNWRIIKYDKDGNYVWQREYDSPYHSTDDAYGVACDASGNVAVVGDEYRGDLAEGFNWRVAKYDAAGTLLWSRTYNAPADGDEAPNGVAFDGGGNILAAGYEYRTDLAQTSNMMLVKYDPWGNVQWTYTYDSPAHHMDSFYGVGVGPGRRVAGVGHSLRLDLGQAYDARIVVLDYGADLKSSLAASPAVSPVTGWVGVTLTVTNNGCEIAEDISPDLSPDAGPGLVEQVSGPIPPSIPVLAPGSSVVFSWTWSASGVGGVNLTATLAGHSEADYATAYSQSTVHLDIIPAAVLSTAVLFNPGPVPKGSPFEVRLVVTNTGYGDATGVTPELEVNWGGSLASVVSGPVPAGPVTVSAGGSVVFTWIYNALDFGSVRFSGTATGTDLVTGSPLEAGRSGTQLIMPPADLGSCPPSLTWSRSVNGIAFGYFFDAAFDSAGNVAVAGEVWGTQTDWLVRKLDPDGGTAWSVNYNSPAGGMDHAYGVGVDSAGDFIVAGSETRGDLGENQNWRITKYGSAAGALVWTRTHDGAKGDDVAWDLAVSPGGDSVVAGHETRTDIGQGENWLVKAFDPGGELAWTRSHTCEQNPANDRATAVALDFAGNVVVAGYDTRAATGKDLLLQKLDSAGALVWERTWNDPGNGDDEPRDVAADSSGNIIVVGREGRSDLGQSDNWFIRKYDSSGNLVWTRSYTSPGSQVDSAEGVAVDMVGRIAVAGFHRPPPSANAEWLVRVYDEAGNLLWQKTHDGLPGIGEFSYGVAVGPTGELAVVGTSDSTYAVVNKYSSDAVLEASFSVSPPISAPGSPVTVTLTVTNVGCGNATGITPDIYVGPGAGLVSLSSGPSPASVAELKSGESAAFTWVYDALAVSTAVFTATAAGTSAMSGDPVSASAGGLLNIFVPVTCAPSAVWTAGYNGTADSWDIGMGVAGDTAGGSVVVGQVNESGESYNWFVRRYDSAGTALWTRTHNGAVSELDSANGVAVSAGGDVVVAGSDRDMINDDRQMVRRYDSSGNVQWTSIWNGAAGNVGAEAYAVSLDGAGNSFVAGRDRLTAGTIVWTLNKFDSSGGLSWSRTYSGGSPSEPRRDSAWGIAYDPADGSVVVAGVTDRTDLGQGNNARLIRVDSSGNLVWSSVYNGPWNGNENFWSVAVDSAGFLIAVGAADVPGQGSNWLVRKYSPSGQVVWSVSSDGGVGGTDYARGIAVYPDDTFVVSGREAQATGGTNWAARKYSGNGQELWKKSFSSPGSQFDEAFGVALDGGGGIVVAGSENRTDLGQSDNLAVRRLASTAVLEGALAAAPASAGVGGWVRLTLTLTNTGCNAAQNVTPTIWVDPGAVLFEPIDGPLPPSVALLNPGATAAFTWTMSASGEGTAVFTATATGEDAVTVLPVAGAGSATVTVAGRYRRVLFYGPTAGGFELATPGIDAVVWDEAQWAAATATMFADFDAIVFGDVPSCNSSTAAWSAAVANRDTWNPVVQGNVIVMGASPDAQGKASFAQQAVRFAAERDDLRPGLYVSLSCVYSSSLEGPVELLEGMGRFRAGRITAGCVDAVHRTSTHPLLAAFDDAALSGWGCSTREGIFSYPSGFMPFAVALWGTAYTACDGVKGTPYIVVRGATLSCADPVIRKEVSPSGIVCGGPVLTYTLSWSNAGTATVRNLTITDTLPNGTVYVKPSQEFWAESDWLGGQGITSSAYSSSLGGPWIKGEPPNGAAAPRFMRWVVDRVSPGKSGYIRFSVDMSGTLAAGSIVTNAVTATITGSPVVRISDAAEVYSGSVTLTLTPSAWAVGRGAGLVYRLMYGNSCGQTVYNLSFWDTLPAGVTFVSATGGGTYDGTKVDWTLAKVMPGEAGFLDVAVLVDGTSAPIGPNHARLEYQDEALAWQPVVQSNTVWVDGLWGVPVLGKASSAGPVVCGGSRIFYTVSWSNAGIGTLENLTITDTLPNGTAYGGATFGWWAQDDWLGAPALAAADSAPDAAGPWTPGEPPAATGPPLVLRWVVDRVAPGKSGYLRYAVDVSGTLAVSSPISNAVTATVTNDSAAYLSAAPVSFAMPGPGIAVTKTLSPAVPWPGGPLTYTIRIVNTGQATITTLKVTDTVPVHVNYSSQTFRSDDPKAKMTFAGPLGGIVSWTGTITLGPADTATVTINCTRDACNTDLVTNTAWVGAGTPCSTTEVAVSDAGFLMPALSFSLVKTPVPASPANGGTVRYRIVVTNTGAATITSVLITDTVPPEITYVGETHPAGWAGAESGGLVIWSGSPVMPPGKAFTVTITGTASLCAVGLVSNTAWARAGTACQSVEATAGGFFDLTTPVMPSVAVVETHNPAAPRNGGLVTFRIVVTNTSAATITQVLVTDTLPAQFTPTAVYQPATLSFNNLGGIASWEGPITVSPGKAFTLTLTGSLALCYTGNVSNTVWVNATSACGSAEDAAVDGFDLTVPLPDLVLSKDAIPATPLNGSPYRYRIMLTNLGQATITNLLVTDTLPAEFNYASESHPAGWTFNNTGGILSWNGAVTMGFGKTFTLTVTGGSSLCYVGPVSNTAWALGTYACGTTEKSAGAFFDLPAAVMPAVYVAESFSPAQPVFGGPVTYRVVVTNTSIATLTQVLVTDTLPPSVSFLSEAHPAGLSFSSVGQLVSWEGPVSVPPNKSFTLTVTGRNLCYTGNVSNSTWVVASNPCGSAYALSATAYDIVTLPATYNLAVTATPAAPKNGDIVRYRLVVSNTSINTITALTIVDTLPAGFDYLSEAHPASVSFTQNGNILSWDDVALVLSPGKALTVTVTGVAGWCHSGPVSNTAWAWSGNSCGAGEDTAQAWFGLSTPLVPAITVRKSYLPAVQLPTSPVTFRIVVTNSFGGTLTSAKVTDTLPTGFNYVSEAHPAGMLFDSVGGVVSWEGPVSVGPNKSFTVTLTGTNLTCYAGPVSNTAWAFADSLCGAAEAASSTAYMLAVPATALAVTQTVTPAVPKNGDIVRYRIVVSNAGGATITELHITDTIPAGFNYSSEAHPAGFASSSAGSLVSWDGPAISLAPGKAFTVTVTGVADWCFAGALSNTAFAYGGNACAVGEGFDESSFTLSTPVVPAISLKKTFSPARPVNGGPVSFRMVLTNLSTGTVTDILVTDTLPAGFTYAAESHPAGLLFTNSGGIASWDGTGLALGPGKSWTMTLSGTTEMCYIGPVSNTAWAWTGGLCGTAEALSGTAYNVSYPIPDFSVVQTVSPAVPKNGNVVQHRIVITNTSLATLATVRVADTLPAGFNYMSESHPAGFAFAAAGSLVSWDGTGLALGPGKAFTVTVTGLADWCYAGPVSNTAWVYAGNQCGMGEKADGVDYTLANPATPAITIRKTYSPANPAAGGPVTFRIVVTNTSIGTLTSLLVTDTLQPEVAYGGEQHPAGFSFAGAGNFLSWSGAVALSPGKAFTMTVTGTNLGCYTGAISNSSWAGASFLCGAVEAASVTGYNVAAGTVNLAGTPALQARISQGQTFQVTHQVTNTSPYTVNGLTPLLNAYRGAALVSLASGPLPASVPVFNPADTATFTWTFNALSTGLVAFSTTALGSACGMTPVVSTAPAVSATIETPAFLEAGLWVSRLRVNTGQNFLLTMTVTNTGSATATAVDAAALRFTWPGAVTLSSGPNPALPVILAGGSARTFTWTFTGSLAGQVVISTTVTGTDANSLFALTTGPVCATVLVEDPAILNAQLVVPFPSACTGKDFLVTLTVTNAGQASATGVAAPTPRQAGTGGAAPVFGPAPVMPVTLAGGEWRVFSWTMTGAVAGSFNLSTTVSGTDANSGAALAVGPLASGAVTISTPGTLASVGAAPGRVSEGQVFTVTLAVTNGGGAAVTGLSASVHTGPGGTLVAGPTSHNPAGPLTLDPLSSRTFTWSYTATASGLAVFSATAWGDTCSGGTALMTQAVGLSTTIVKAAVLEASASLLATTVCSGSDFLVTLTVTNSGEAAATGIAVAPWYDPAPGGYSIKAGPFPPMPMASLAGGAARTFTWTLTGGPGPGVIELSTTVAGTDENSLKPLSFGPVVAGSATVLASADLFLYAFTNPSPLLWGRPFTVTLYVENLGIEQGDLLVPSLAVTSGASLVTGPAGPASPPDLNTIGPVSSTAFTWSYTATGLGTVDFDASLFVYTCPGPRTITIPLSVQVVNPVSLSTVITVKPVQCGVDEVITVEMVVTSTGVLPAHMVTPSALTVGGTGQVVPLTGPDPRQDQVLDPGEKVTFRWTYRTIRGGSVEFAGSASANNGMATTVSSAAAPGTLAIVEARNNLDGMLVYPNPFDPSRAIDGAMKFRFMAPSTQVTLFTIAGERVRIVKADWNGMATWDGRNGDGTSVTPGVYIFLAETPRGQKRRGKVQVIR